MRRRRHLKAAPADAIMDGDRIASRPVRETLPSTPVLLGAACRPEIFARLDGMAAAIPDLRAWRI